MEKNENTPSLTKLNAKLISAALLKHAENFLKTDFISMSETEIREYIGGYKYLLRETIKKATIK